MLDLRYPLPKIWTQAKSRRFAIYWSDTLQYGAFFPKPSNTELASFYEIDSYSDYLSERVKTQKPNERRFIDHVIFKLAYQFDRGIEDPIPSILRLSPSSKPTVCDIGCGSGNFLSRMKAYADDVVGIDPSPVSGKAVKARGVEFYQGTAEQIPVGLKRRRFDVVTLFQSLEHCRNPEKTLLNAKRLTKPGGLLVIDVPNIDCLGFRAYRQVWFHTDAGRHLHFFTPKALKILCERIGLKQLAIEYSSFARQFSREWITAMQRVWDALYENAPTVDAPPRPTMALSCRVLARSIVSPPRLRYDIFRIYARPYDEAILDASDPAELISGPTES